MLSILSVAATLIAPVISPGDTMACRLHVPENTRVVGPATIIQTPECDGPALIVDGPGVQVVGLKLVGNAASREFTEGAHLIEAHNADGLIVTGNSFEQITGDGLIVYDADGVTISGNTFLGPPDGDYRDWISLIDAQHVTITGNQFWTPTVRNDMPGGITLEPDTLEQSVTDVTIERNVFVSKIEYSEAPIQVWHTPWWRRTRAVVERITVRRNALVGKFMSTVGGQK